MLCSNPAEALRHDDEQHGGQMELYMRCCLCIIHRAQQLSATGPGQGQGIMQVSPSLYVFSNFPFFSQLCSTNAGSHIHSSGLRSSGRGGGFTATFNCLLSPKCHGLLRLCTE